MYYGRNDFCNWDRDYVNGGKTPVNVYFGRNWIQFRNWRIADYDGMHSSISYTPYDPRAKDNTKTTAMIWRGDGIRKKGPRGDYNGWAMKNRDSNPRFDTTNTIKWGNR